FGHDAIVVVDPASGEATSYNFGYFDPSEDDFISRFVRGDMMYYLVALPLQQDLSYYDAEAPVPRIGVVTMQPGTVFFERFGHDAIVVVDPASGEATSYNFGYFDPSEDDFIS
ncbi:hypothetical protein C7E12_18685, partial [Stenotrophomonas maltophilia]